MVLTRSQAAKNKADQSPEAPKVTRKQKHAPGDDLTAAAGGVRLDPPLGDKAPKRQGMSSQMAKLAKLRIGPSSHPITSLPCSPALSPEAGISQFTIPAVLQEDAQAQQQQAQQALQASVGDALASLAAAQAADSAAESLSSARSVDDKQGGAPGSADGSSAALPAEGSGATLSAPACPSPSLEAPPADMDQQAQPPAAPAPRAEKLLKPLPDKPIPCDKLPDGPEPVVVEVEYVASQDLQAVDDTDAALESLAPGLGAADWPEAVRTLNLLRQLAVHHPLTCSQQLDQLLPLVLKSVRSLRSSVCKTAIMAVADLYTAYGDELLPHTDVGGALRPATSLLAQLLLKVASNDKKFVVEEAQRALQVVVQSLTPAELLPLLLPYADTHKNPRVRGKAGAALADSVARMRPADVLAFGHAALLKVAGKLVTDNTPDARDAAKRLIGLLRAAFAEPDVEAALAVEAPAPPPQAEPKGEGDELPAPPSKWEAYCQATLSGSAALAVLKASAE